MYEINGFIIWYDTKTHKWSIRADEVELIQVSGIKEVKKWCEENKNEP